MKDKIFRIVLIAFLTIGNGVLIFSDGRTKINISNVNVTISTQKAKDIRPVR